MNLKAPCSSKDSDIVDEANLDRSNDMSSRTKIRRSRLRMLFEEFQNEIVSLEEKVEKCTLENAKLKAVNEELRQQLEDSTAFSMKLTSETIDGSKGNAEISTVGDISTIIKLSNKLQEMVHVNENITRVNAALRKDLKNLTNERELHLQDISKLQEENFSRSPDPYSRYNVFAMKEKIDNYEREINQWKTDMKRADDHIADLSKELETYKRTNNNINVSRSSVQSNQMNDFPGNDRTLNRVESSSVPLLENQRKRMAPVVANGSATEALQKLVSRMNPTTKERSSDEELIHDVYNTDNSSFKSQLLDVPNEAEQQTIASPKETVGERSEKLSGNGDLFSDPVRFPACVKLLELTKARNPDDNLTNTPSSTEQGKHFNTIPSPGNMLFWNNGMAFTNNGGNHSNGSPVVPHRPASNLENRSNKGDVDDDITIVLPSSDHSLIQHTPDSETHSRDMLFQSPRSFEAGSRSRIEQELSPISECNHPVSVNNNSVNMIPNPSDYSYYHSNTYQGGHNAPLKKVKVEDSDK